MCPGAPTIKPTVSRPLAVARDASLAFDLRKTGFVPWSPGFEFK